MNVGIVYISFELEKDICLILIVIYVSAERG